MEESAMNHHCEWCALPARWRYWRGEYERFSCNEHIAKTRWLLSIDLGAVLYQFEAVEGGVPAIN